MSLIWKVKTHPKTDSINKSIWCKRTETQAAQLIKVSTQGNFYFSLLVSHQELIKRGYRSLVKGSEWVKLCDLVFGVFK